ARFAGQRLYWSCVRLRSELQNASRRQSSAPVTNDVDVTSSQQQSENLFAVPQRSLSSDQESGCYHGSQQVRFAVTPGVGSSSGGPSCMRGMQSGMWNFGRWKSLAADPRALASGFGRAVREIGVAHKRTVAKGSTPVSSCKRRLRHDLLTAVQKRLQCPTGEFLRAQREAEISRETSPAARDVNMRQMAEMAIAVRTYVITAGGSKTNM
ncbi:hypothetical protein AWZ03_014641, partial [Drosophila navojoa]